MRLPARAEWKVGMAGQWSPERHEGVTEGTTQLAAGTVGEEGSNGLLQTDPEPAPRQNCQPQGSDSQPNPMDWTGRLAFSKLAAPQVTVPPC